MDSDVISIETLSDRSSSPGLEIVSNEQAQLTPKELRIKLLNFLVVSPPPTPIRWKSFKNFVVSRFKTYYPKEVIGDVYDQLRTAIISKKKPVTIADSDVDSERQSNSSESPSSRIRRSVECSTKKTVTKAVQAQPAGSDDDECAVNSVSSSTKSGDSQPLFSKSEFKSLCSNDSAVKKHSRYIKEMYAILEDIQISTSCSICKKLKTRLDKFKEHLSSESLGIRKKIIERRQIKSNEPRDDDTGDRNKKKVPSGLVLAERNEQLLKDYLVKKVMEASLPEIAKMAEAKMEPFPLKSNAENKYSEEIKAPAAKAKATSQTKAKLKVKTPRSKSQPLRGEKEKNNPTAELGNAHKNVIPDEQMIDWEEVHDSLEFTNDPLRIDPEFLPWSQTDSEICVINGSISLNKSASMERMKHDLAEESLISDSEFACDSPANHELSELIESEHSCSVPKKKKKKSHIT